LPRKRALAAGAACAALAALAIAQEELVPGPGAELTQAKCAVCHEIEHVVRSRQSRAEWEETMRRLVQRGAPLAPDEIRVITDYLATYYNREGPSAAALAASAQAAAAQAQADPVTQLLNKNACLGCHAVEKQVVGPAFRDVAARYKGNAAAPAALAKKVKEGGQGVWGQVPMPPNPGLSDADAKLMVEWVLTRQ
jgi:sulfite dehydrogenase